MERPLCELELVAQLLEHRIDRHRRLAGIDGVNLLLQFCIDRTEVVCNQAF